jgi:hypothetical protein
MIRRTRYFLIGSALVVVVGLCAGLVAYYGGALPGLASGPDELVYVPSDASTVGYADLRSIMKSDFRQGLSAVVPTGDQKSRLEAEIGVDLERDIDGVVASLGTGAPDTARVLLSGRLEAARRAARPK